MLIEITHAGFSKETPMLISVYNIVSVGKNGTGTRIKLIDGNYINTRESYDEIKRQLKTSELLCRDLLSPNVIPTYSIGSPVDDEA